MNHRGCSLDVTPVVRTFIGNLILFAERIPEEEASAE
jgi:hypothetical protein